MPPALKPLVANVALIVALVAPASSRAGAANCSPPPAGDAALVRCRTAVEARRYAQHLPDDSPFADCATIAKTLTSCRAASLSLDGTYALLGAAFYMGHRATDPTDADRSRIGVWLRLGTVAGVRLLESDDAAPGSGHGYDALRYLLARIADYS